MSTASIFDAQPYDFAKARRRRNTIIAVSLAVIVIGGLLFWFRNLPYERQVDKFFSALQSKDYEQAYGVWMNDAEWKQHPQKYARYNFNTFYTDWGPSGDWGVIESHHVDDAVAPKKGGSGVVIVTTVNGRKERSCLWVEKKDKTLSFPPMKTIDCL
jgi:hypothetical protein